MLTDGDLVVVNLSDILQYLDWRIPNSRFIPRRSRSASLHAPSSGWAITFDPIVVDCSYWHWAERDDEPPAGLLAAAQRDIDELLIISSACCCRVRSRGRSARLVSSNAPGLPTSPPCARLASPSTSSAFPSSQMVSGDANASGLRRRRSAHRCISEGVEAPDPRAQAAVLERRPDGVADIARVPPMVCRRNRCRSCGVPG